MSEYSGSPPRPDRLQRRAARHHMRRPPAYGRRAWDQETASRPPPVFRKPWYQSGIAKIIIMLLIVSLFFPIGTFSLWILIILVIIYFFTRRRQETPRRPPPYPLQQQFPPERYPSYPPRQQPTLRPLPAAQRASSGAIPAGQQSRQQTGSVFIYPERPQYVSSAKLTCFSCGEPYDPENKFCTECGKPISRCNICRGVIGFGDTLSQCPYCQNEFHHDHVREWLKVSGDCPVCRQRIREAELITTMPPVAKKKRSAIS